VYVVGTGDRVSIGEDGLGSIVPVDWGEAHAARTTLKLIRMKKKIFLVVMITFFHASKDD
jgi:hypothetical protein